MSAKIVLTDEDYANIEDWAAYCTQQQISDQLNISRSTLNNLFDSDTKALRHYKKGKAKGAKMVGSSLFKKAIKGDMTAAIFYLKTQCGWKEPKEEDKKDININLSTYEMPDNGRVKVKNDK